MMRTLRLRRPTGGWAVAIVAVLLLVVDVLFSRTQAWLTAGAVAALLVWWWVAVPFYQRSHSQQDPLPDDEEDADPEPPGRR